MHVSTVFIQPEAVSPGELSRTDAGETVRVTGNVSGFYSTDSGSFFTLKGSEGGVKVADFKGRRLENGERVSVSGSVKLYRGEMEIVSTEIEQK